MPRFRHPISNKYIEITDELEEQMRHLVREQGIFHYQAYEILTDQTEAQLEKTLEAYV